MRRLVLLSGLAVVVVTSALASESLYTNTLPVITGTRISEELSTSPSSVSVVLREQIDAQQIQTLADALRGEAGVNLAHTGQAGQQTSLLLRGANANQTLVLIDGIRVNSPFNNNFDFANLAVDNIDHIEVIRGPQSTLYGSEALGGVINIVTKQCAGQPTGSAFVEGGSDDSLRTREAFTGSFGNLYLDAETSYFTTDNERINSDYFAWNSSGRATYHLLERLNASVLGTYLNSHAGTPGDRFSNDPNDSLNNENLLVAVTLDGQPTEWWDAKLTLSHDHERAFFNEPTPNPPFFFPLFTDHTITDRNQIDLQNIFTINAQHKILFGGTYDDSHAHDESQFDNFGRTITDKALYGQYEFTPISRLTATAGGRVDDYSSFGTHGTYKFAVRGTVPGSETILRSSVGTGFRAPSVVQLATAFGGNPNLQPEQSLGWDVGIEQPLANNKVHVGVTYFQNEFDNLIISSNVPPPVFSELVNTGRARTLGLENFAAWTPLPDLTLRGTYTWLAEAEDLTHRQALLRRPAHSGSFNVDYHFAKKFTADFTATFVGERHDMNFNTGARVTVGGYAKLDLALRYDVCKYFSVLGRVENLTDEQYEDVFGFPALGRTFWGGGQVKF